MARTVRVRFSQGVIKPLEKVEFLEGEEFTVTIYEIHEKPKRKTFRNALKATAGGWKDLINAEELKRNVYGDRSKS